MCGAGDGDGLYCFVEDAEPEPEPSRSILDLARGAWQYNRPCAQQSVGKHHPCMVISGRFRIVICDTYNNAVPVAKHHGHDHRLCFAARFCSCLASFLAFKAAIPLAALAAFCCSLAARLLLQMTASRRCRCGFRRRFLCVPLTPVSCGATASTMWTPRGALTQKHLRLNPLVLPHSSAHSPGHTHLLFLQVPPADAAPQQHDLVPGMPLSLSSRGR